MTKNVFAKAKWRFQVENMACSQMIVYANWFLTHYYDNDIHKSVRNQNFCYIELKKIRFNDDSIEIDYYVNPYRKQNSKIRHAVIPRKYIVSFDKF